LDVVAIGNAIVDVIARSDDAFLAQHALTKGGMQLIDADMAETLYADMPQAKEISGGSAANTLAGLAALGKKCGFIGQVNDDQLGAVFAHDVHALGIRFDTPAVQGDIPTARCLILVTPDAQRTMNTFLGACVTFGPDDVEEAEVASAAVTYMEGYLFDPPAAQEAFRKAAKIAHGAGRKVSLTLSDAFCVGRHRAAFRDLVKHEVDILFANESELLSLYETEDFATALAAVRAEVGLAAVTRSEKGSVIVAGGATAEVAAVPTTVVDPTGAGDAYAAGFLAAHAKGLALAECGRWGSVAAAEAISHFGARPQTDLKALVAA
jgi:fructokinase